VVALAVAGVAAAESAPEDADRVAEMTAAQARDFAIDQIRALVAIARAGGQQPDPQCRAAAASAGNLAGAAIDAVVHADKARTQALRVAGAAAADDPTVQASYQQVAAAALDARRSVAGSIASCPDPAALRR
jgi:hypothetical protein